MLIQVFLCYPLQGQNRADADFDVGFCALDNLTLFGDFDRFVDAQPQRGGIDAVGDQSLLVGLCLTMSKM